MDTAILVICIVVAALFLAAVIFKAVLLAKQLKADKAAAEQDDGIRYLEIVQGEKTVRLEGEAITRKSTRK